MNTAVKVVLSVVLFIIGFLCMGLWPYITVIPCLLLFAGAMIAIVAIWKKRPVEGEGDIFRNKDKLNKD
jgi:hypothetical protein